MKRALVFDDCGKGSDAPSRFGMIAFGIIGTIYGILELLPWTKTTSALLTSSIAGILWSIPFVLASVFVGRRYGGRFVALATAGHFARAAGLVIASLFVSGVVYSAVYCAGLVVVGDFGSAEGIFGSFKPDTLFKKLMGTVILFFGLVLRHAVSSVIIGFVAGYFTALFFDREWKTE